MTKELEQKMMTTLDWVGEVADGSKEFILEQAPIYAQEIIAWHFWSNTIVAVLCLISLIPLIKYTNKWLKRIKDIKEENKGLSVLYGQDVEGPIAIVSLLVCTIIVVILMASSSSIDAAKAKMAPRVLIMEHFRGNL